MTVTAAATYRLTAMELEALMASRLLPRSRALAASTWRRMSPTAICWSLKKKRQLIKKAGFRPRLFLSLMHRFLPVLEQRRKKIFDHTPGAGFDFDGHGHAGGKADQSFIDLHLCFVERDAGGVDEFLAFGFTCFIFSTGFILAVR